MPLLGKTGPKSREVHLVRDSLVRGNRIENTSHCGTVVPIVWSCDHAFGKASNDCPDCCVHVGTRAGLDFDSVL